MDRTYWLSHWRVALAKAGSVKATRGPPFLLPHRGPATEGEREALRLPLPALRKLPALPGGKRRDAGKGADR